MNGPFSTEYWKAAKNEINILEGMGTWDGVKCKNDMSVIIGTVAIKWKRFLNGTVKKFKALIFACGDQQLEKLNFFETYAPVVQWTTNHLMLILEKLLGLKSRQADVNVTFLAKKIWLLT